MIYILHSADYELYLGGNTLPEEEVLIQPTQQLLDLYEKLGISTTLFCDVLCLMRYRTLKRDTFPDLAEKQLKQAVNRGMDVQTHLHPHWLNTKIQQQEVGNQYHFEPKQYLLGTLDPDENNCFLQTKALLTQASQTLTSWFKPIDKNYQCLAFRAGGYGLQPRSNIILKALQETGYHIDSSIIPRAKFQTNVQAVDFSQVPTQANYWLHDTTGLTTTSQPGKGIVEIPIASTLINPKNRWHVFGWEAIRQASQIVLGSDLSQPLRGYPCNTTTTSSRPLANRFKRAYWRSQTLLANRFLRLELNTNPTLMMKCVKSYLKDFDTESQDIFFSLNCHPKGITTAHLIALETFHKTLEKQYGENIMAITFQQAWERIKPQ